MNLPKWDEWQRTEIGDLDVLVRVVEQKVLRLQVLSAWQMRVNKKK